MLAKTYVDRLNEACNYVKARLNDRPDIGIILGSGLGSYGNELVDPIKIPYKEIPQMLDTTVPGHSGCLIFGKIGERKVLCLSGRSHQYEGLYPHEVQFAIRLLIVCGCKLCILTNAAGTRDPELNVGDLCPIYDHMNFTHRGYTEESLKQKPFHHLVQTELYDAEADKLAKLIAQEQGFQSKGCCYVYNFGPTYETKAEVEGEFLLGGTNFGMSTVPEVIAAKELGIPILAMSFCTNKAAGVTGAPLTHEEVAQAAKAGEPKMKKLITEFICRYPLKDSAIPVVEGDNFNIARPRPQSYVSDEEISEIAKQFNETSIDALVIVNGAHTLSKFTAKATVKAIDLPKFPLMQHENLELKFGEIEGHNVVVVDGFNDLCGLEPHALNYLIALAKSLGATQFIQTFASGAVDGFANPSIVGDVIPFFERTIACSKCCSGYYKDAATILPSVPHVVLATYHGPEFPTQHEVGGLVHWGAQHVALGCSKGLLIARAYGLQSVGIADGAYPAIIKSGTTEDIINSCRSKSGAIEDLISAVIKLNGGKSKGFGKFEASNIKAFKWNDIPSSVQNHQEDPAAVAALKDKLPKVANYILLDNSKVLCTLAEKLTDKKEIEVSGYKIITGKLSGKDVALVISDKLLVRAIAKIGAKVLLIAPVIATSSELKDKYVTFINHFSMGCDNTLVGRNLDGTRFTEVSNLYEPVKGLKEVIAFSIIDLKETTPAYAKAMNTIHCDVATRFGPTESVLERHAEGKPIAAIGVVVECPCKEWTIEENIILPVLQ